MLAELAVQHLDSSKTLIVCSNPAEVFLYLFDTHFERYSPRMERRSKEHSHFKDTGISDEAWISETASIGEGCSIFPGAYIGPGVSIGRGSVIHGGARICDKVTIGEFANIGPNSVIGGPPFFLRKSVDGEYESYPAYGTVRVAERVLVGACTCIDRGVFEDTVIEAGAKLDNLIHVGHGARIGARSIVAGQTGFAGNASLGIGSIVEGQAGIAPNVVVAANSVIHGKAVISRNIRQEGGEYYGPRARSGREEALRENTMRLLMAADQKLLKALSQQVDDVQSWLKNLVADEVGLDSNEIRDHSVLTEIGLDSLSMLNVIVAIETQFDIELASNDAQSIETFHDLVRGVLFSRLNGKS